MKKLKIRATSDISWLEAARQLIQMAQQQEMNLSRLSIKEDHKAPEGRFRLKTKLQLQP
ncbi:hypothetical protein [Cesiribacter andamanensis]|uniref:Uncharacterized protein n=1 Tax=Cesiribacter andamanensis AMV16 TaxID=1279009 RepID=M7N3B5_9BACT|nr:hypothetical protein [Cesiribacter andamanensis]EMR03178.1 hypothetical protein ADICEAN_01656 [Cesiribacter andamanensis AMV16]